MLYDQTFHYSSAISTQPSQRSVSPKRFIVRLGLLIILAVIFVSFTYNAIAYAVGTGGANEIGVDLTKPVVVQPGDTLSELASEHAPEHMSRDQFIYEVRQLNDLDNSLLMVGQILQVPVK